MNVSNLINHNGSGSTSSTSSCISIDTLLNPSLEPPNKRVRRHRIDNISRVSTNRCIVQSPVSVSSWPRQEQITEVSIADLPPTTGSLKPYDNVHAVILHRLAQSRLIGLRHRENERTKTIQLGLDITALQQESDILAFRIQEIKRNQAEKDLALVPSPRSPRNPESTVTLSSSSSRIIDSSNISGESALLLLELIALRRNMVPLHRYEGISPNTALFCPEYWEVENAVKQRTTKVWDPNIIEWHAAWADHEANNSKTEEGREQFAKKCTRCSKPRKAGGGHPRSSCDDGFRIASLVPYRDHK